MPNEISFGDIISRANRKEREIISKHCKRKGISTDELTREALDYYHRKYIAEQKKLNDDPNTPEGLKALNLIKNIMLEFAKGL